MRSLLPLTVYCISLVSLQQLLALPAEERPDRNRWDLLTKLKAPRQDKASLSGSQTNTADPSAASNLSPKWLSDFRSPHLTLGETTGLSSLDWARPLRRAPRARRHAFSGSRGQHHPHHGQLMRVGCVLGTCQVQNLSHRLYQLLGQSDREDTSPINPRSPHSYG